MIAARRTIGASNNVALLKGLAAKNNGRYNGNGREWETPPELFKLLDDEFHFTLDPCATDLNAKCRRYFTEKDNGLTQPWRRAGTRPNVFMNPPYGREIAAWTRKARGEAEFGALVVGLLPASTDLAWWHEDVVGHAEVRYIRGRVRFLTGGPYRASGFFASVIVIWPPQLPDCPVGACTGCRYCENARERAEHNRTYVKGNSK
jgi:phage N-6-adenine-methyltransferase